MTSLNQKQKLKIRPIRASDIQLFNDGRMYNHSVRGIAVEKDGETLAIAGVLHSSPMQVFSQMSDSMRDYPVMIMKTAKRLTDIMSGYSANLYALASEQEANSKLFLERLGFKPIGSNDGGSYYIWVQ